MAITPCFQTDTEPFGSSINLDGYQNNDDIYLEVITKKLNIWYWLNVIMLSKLQKMKKCKGK